MSKIQVNDIVNHFDDGAPNFPKGIVVGSGATLGFNVGTGASIYSPSDNVLTLGTNNTEKVRITSDGKVGIGAPAPAKTLEVKGDVRIYNATDTSSAILDITADSTSSNGVNLTSTYFGSGGFGPIRFTTSDTERLRITSGGNVNIGPSANANDHGLLTLSQSASAAFNALVIQQGNTAFTATDGLHIGIDAGVNAYLKLYENRDFYFTTGTSNTEKLRITSGGNIGIATDNPQTKLELFTDDNTDISDNTGTNNTNSILRLFNKNGTDGGAVDNYVGIRFDVANGATSSAWLDYVRTGDNQGAFLFKARNASSSYPELMRVSSGGIITKPNHPCFMVRNSTAANAFSSNAKATWNQISVNNGSHFDNSNDRFVCPIDGFYFFSCQLLSNNGVRLFTQLNKNGSRVDGTRTESYDSITSYQTNTFVAVVQASANDYFEVEVGNNGGYGNIYANFNGHLIG